MSGRREWLFGWGLSRFLFLFLLREVVKAVLMLRRSWRVSCGCTGSFSMRWGLGWRDMGWMS